MYTIAAHQVIILRVESSRTIDTCQSTLDMSTHNGACKPDHIAADEKQAQQPMIKQHNSSILTAKLHL